MMMNVYFWVKVGESYTTDPISTRHEASWIYMMILCNKGFRISILQPVSRFAFLCSDCVSQS